VIRNMSIPKVSCILLIFLFAVSIFSSVATARGASESEATSASNQADETVTAAYIATLKAEEAGADISDLLTQLDEAGELLARAHMAYRSYDFDEATHFANLANSIGAEIQSEADVAKVAASAEGQQHLAIAIIVSVVSAVLVVIGSFFGWRVFKRRYYERVLKMKPEVV
jgi:beta-lactamase regulating signal transducer with metallopeptidase domain